MWAEPMGHTQHQGTERPATVGNHYHTEDKKSGVRNSVHGAQGRRCLAEWEGTQLPPEIRHCAGREQRRKALALPSSCVTSPAGMPPIGGAKVAQVIYHIFWTIRCTPPNLGGNGGVSYSPNVAYLACGGVGGGYLCY